MRAMTKPPSASSPAPPAKWASKSSIENLLVNDEEPIDVEDRHVRRLQQMMTAAELRAPTHEHQSFNEYRKQRYDALQSFVTSRRKIYLDTKFWVWLREPAASPNPTATSALLERLQHGVEQGHFCCPVSYPIFCETAKI